MATDNNFKKLANGIQLVPNATTEIAAPGDIDYSTDTGKFNFWGSGGASPGVTESGAQTLTNKTITVTGNTIVGTVNTVAQFDATTGALESSSVSNTVLGYLTGVTSNIQTQLNSKQSFLTFSDSLVNTSGTVTLVNDTPTPGVSSYYGTNGSSVLGYYPLSGATGSVTSVAMTVPSFLSVSGSPITTSGTFAVTLSGTALPIANGGTNATSATSAYNNLSPMTTTGDMEYEVSAGVAGRLGIGSSGQVLTVSSGVPSWQTFTALTNPMTSTGDLIYSSNGSGTPTRLPIGTSGQVLEVAAGIPSWVTQGSAENPGVVKMYAGTSIPSGYFLCDGTAYSRTTYAALFTAIATNYGNGDGSTTFNVPDFRGLFPRGVDNGAGNDPDSASRTAVNGGNSGDNIGSYQANQNLSHTHSASFTFYDGSAGSADGVGGSANQGSNPKTQTVSVSADGGNQSNPNNLYINFIIKQ